MKRRLPTTNQGESVLVVTTIPPLTDATNRQRPTTAQPGRASAALHAAVIASSAHAAGSRSGVTTSPPRSTANAAKPTATRAALSLKRRHHPRAVV